MKLGRLSVFVAFMAVLAVVLAACGRAETPTPQVIQVEVTRVVTEEVVGAGGG